jgi:hypothetical protein
VYVFHDFSFSVRVVLFWKKKKRSDTSEACHLEFMPDNDPVEISQPPADPGLFDHMEYGKLKFHVKPDDRDDRDSSASSTQTTTKEDRRLEPPRKADPKVFEFPAEQKEKPVMPWEIDLRGRPLKDKAKYREPTEYEKWVERKKKTEGVEVRCPKCGTINIDLAFVTGEKCTKCGFALEKYEDLDSKIRESDVVAGRANRQRLIDNPYRSSIMSLDLPGSLLKNPDSDFSYEFTSGSWLLYFMIMVGSIIGVLFLIIRLNSGLAESSMELIFLVILSIVFIYSISGLSQTLRVTTIRTDQEGVSFIGCGTKEYFTYGEIKSIKNNREANGRAGFTGLSASPLAWLMFIGPWIYFVGWRYMAFHFLYNDESYFDEGIDSSSASPYYTNNIEIASDRATFEYSFTGAGNVAFARALAIMIFMAGRKNKNCIITQNAVRAAEKSAMYSNY